MSAGGTPSCYSPLTRMIVEEEGVVCAQDDNINSPPFWLAVHLLPGQPIIHHCRNYRAGGLGLVKGTRVIVLM